jgi:hypothetical protein
MHGKPGSRVPAALTVILLMICAPGLPAQTSQLFPANEAPFPLGPVTLYPSFSFRDVGVDSNVRNEAVDAKEDFTLTAEPRLRATVPLGSALLTTAATLGFVYYATYKDQQSFNRRIEGRLEGVTSRLRPFLVAAFDHTRERAGYEIDARVLREEATLTGGAELKLTGVTSLTAFYSHATHNYGDEERFVNVALADQLDHASDIASAGVRYALTPLTTISVDVEVQRDRFDTFRIRDSDSVRVIPSVQFSPDAVIKGRAALGFRQFMPHAASLEGFQGLVGSANIGYTLLNATTFSGDFTRDVMYSFAPATPYFLVTSGRVTVSQRLGGPIEAIALAGQDTLRYQGVEGLPVQGRVERTAIIGGGIGFRVSPALRIALIYDRTERVADERDRRAYDRRRLFASATYGQ